MWCGRNGWFVWVGCAIDGLSIIQWMSLAVRRLIPHTHDLAVCRCSELDWECVSNRGIGSVGLWVSLIFVRR